MSGFRNAGGVAVNYVSDEQRHDEWKGPDRWMWISINDEDRCSDCADRDGKVKTWGEWVALGMPGEGTKCEWQCRCRLEPQENADFS